MVQVALKAAGLLLGAVPVAAGGVARRKPVRVQASPAWASRAAAQILGVVALAWAAVPAWAAVAWE